MRDNNPKVKVPESFESWGKEADLMLTRDNRTMAEVEAVLDFSQHDHFWRCNILSMKKLREKFDQLFLHMQEKKTHAQNKTKATDTVNIHDFLAAQDNL